MSRPPNGVKSADVLTLAGEGIGAMVAASIAMKISVIVPAYNEEKLISATLQSIREAAQPFLTRGWEVEIIVCDNNSSDRTAELAAAGGAKVVFEPVNQISRARNSGAASATGDWFIFVDADSQPPRGLFEDVAKAIEAEKYVGGGATVFLETRDVAGKLLVLGWNALSRTLRWCAGSFVWVRAEAFREIGGFSLKLFASEELDFSRRLKRLARVRGQRLIILHRNPIRTSDRKIHLYSKAAYLRLFMRALVAPRRTLQSREACEIWYDGRR